VVKTGTAAAGVLESAQNTNLVVVSPADYESYPLGIRVESGYFIVQQTYEND